MAGNYTYTFADHSGIKADYTDPNPYNALLKACSNDAAHISALYQKHRTTREYQQRNLLTSPNFVGVTIDPILRKLLDEEARSTDEKTGYTDPRYCAVLWARPPARIRALVAQCQDLLREVLPNAYFQPPQDLHLTVLELAHSLTSGALSDLVKSIPKSVVERAIDLPHDLAEEAPEPAAAWESLFIRVNQPMITYDGSALAISFLPAVSRSVEVNRGTHLAYDDDPKKQYTYHHLRRDLWGLFNVGNVPVASRYVVPSCHMTIARFVNKADTSKAKTGDEVSDPAKMQDVVEKIEEINQWLKEEYGVSRKGEWSVGEEKGLVFRTGTLWYGGGMSVKEGKSI